MDGLAQLSFVIHGILERRAAGHDLSIIQTRLLGVLRDRRLTMNQLATLLALDKSSITGLVDRAERRGLVERIPSTTDRRSVLVGLTDDGRSLISGVSAGFETDLSMVLDPLAPSERETLSALLSRMLVAYASDHGVDLFATIDTEAPSRGQPSGSGGPEMRIDSRPSRATPERPGPAADGQVL